MKPYKHFTMEERESLYLLLKLNKNVTEIAKELGRNKSSVSREINRNKNKNGEYNPWGAYSKYRYRRKRCIRKYRIAEGTELYNYIIECLEKFWSPEIIVLKWKEKHPDEKLSFSTIYHAIHNKLLPNINAKKHLRRHGKKQYGKRSKFNTIQPEHTIHERPQIIEDRLRLGDFEGDTVCGAVGKGGLLTLVDRKSRFLIAILIANFKQETIYAAMLKAFEFIKPKSITLDNGSEFAMFKELERELGVPIYFADPHSPWQRGSNENMNDQLRFFFPKGCNFHDISQADVDYVVDLLNSKPRFCLDLNSAYNVFCCT